MRGFVRVAQELARRHPEIRIARHEKNRGKGAALKAYPFDLRFRYTLCLSGPRACAELRGSQGMARGRSLAEFQKAFADEASCATFLFKRRWPAGFVCPACGKRRANALKTRPRLFECLDCGRQTSLTAGTVMHRSRLPLTTWFQAAHLMTTPPTACRRCNWRPNLASPTRLPGC